MNLHISHDNVFMDYIIPIAREVDPGNNRFLIFPHDNSEKARHVKSSEISFAKYDSDDFHRAIGKLSQYRNIFIHWLEGFTASFAVKIPEGVNVIWCFWGGDGLEIPALRESVYQEKSLEYFRKNSRIKIRSVGALKKFYWKKLQEKVQLNAMQRVNYFAHYLKEDFEKVSKAANMHATFIDFHYAAVEDIVPADEEFQFGGSDILLGNSDTLSNNHFEAIDKISSIDLHEVKIICPLSYERGKYAKDIAAYGKQKLGDSFIPLMDFLPKNEYDKILSRINSAVMNHNRSQALGNITSLLWKGARLYMSGKNALYHFLRNNGCIVSTLDSITPDDAVKQLSLQDKENNRQVLLKLFGKERQKEKIRKMLSL